MCAMGAHGDRPGMWGGTGWLKGGDGRATDSNYSRFEVKLRWDGHTSPGRTACPLANQHWLPAATAHASHLCTECSLAPDNRFVDDIIDISSDGRLVLLMKYAVAGPRRACPRF